MKAFPGALMLRVQRSHGKPKKKPKGMGKKEWEMRQMYMGNTRDGS